MPKCRRSRRRRRRRAYIAVLELMWYNHDISVEYDFAFLVAHTLLVFFSGVGVWRSLTHTSEKYRR